MDGNMDDGLLSLTGFIRIDIPGDYDIRSESDDGSIIWIAGERVVDNDGSHGSPYHQMDFITSKPLDSTQLKLPGLMVIGPTIQEHGGANLNVLLDGDPVLPKFFMGQVTLVGLLFQVSLSAEKGAIGLAGQYWASDPKGFEFGEGSHGPVFQLHQRIITAFTQSIQNRKALSSQPTLNIPATILRL